MGPLKVTYEDSGGRLRFTLTNEDGGAYDTDSAGNPVPTLQGATVQLIVAGTPARTCFVESPYNPAVCYYDKAASEFTVGIKDAVLVITKGGKSITHKIGQVHTEARTA
jgi:hypothetical protein